ncbi:Cobalt-zinc-cadmium resistance protein CzcA [Labilithrix luteola]|uniref:Cobalt-zinc-cadmium resistance protein CzcA n=1 Tax=Labilithrix luteola TaxID=1391654 RepID=A0A0K1PVC5_9BACT|nr:efflux RND transporter permease subunit [Labilithrix luteola]AKU97079.1 Cobalt-zinc-cadmium resistance protein CzcA [Labilithrix luteola]
MTRLALKNPIFVLMLCLALVVFASVVTPRMSVDTFPELSPPVLVIGTKAQGMGPKDVEKTLTWQLEKAVSATPGVDHVESVSRSGLSIIFVWLKWGTDLNAAQSVVQQQVTFAMSSVPKTLGIIPPFILQYDPSNAPVLQVAVYGKGISAAQLYDYAANNIEPLIEGIPGVASAAPDGGKERQINVVVDPAKAAARGLSSSDIAKAVDKANALLPSGRFNPPTFSANVYTNAVPKTVTEIGDAVVKMVDGKPVLLRDVARIEDAGSKDAQSVTINGTVGVYLNVLRVPGGNVVQINDQVRKIVENLKDLPPGIQVEPIFDQSHFVRETIEGLVKEIAQALVLIGLVILVFLQSARSVLIAAIAVPISFAIILIVLYVTGQSLNAFTLGGLTLSMGPLVDISVVVLESVHRNSHGRNRVAAALHGANAIAIAALAATLSTIAVLLPVVLLAGLAKKLFAPLALTVATGMVAGYIVSMLVTPVACRYFLPKEHKEPGRLAKALAGGVDKLAVGYSKLLRAVLGYRVWVIAGALTMVAGAIVASSRLPTTFFPDIDESMEQVYVRFTPGTSLDDASAKTVAMAKTLEEKLPPGSVKLVLTNVGSPSKARSAMTSPNMGTHQGFIRVELTEAGKRKLDQRELADRMREILEHTYPGVDFLQAPGGLVASVFSNGYIAPLVVEINGDDLETMLSDSRAVADVARGVTGIRDVYVRLENDYPELRVDTDRETAGLVGVNARDAAQTTLEATLGNVNAPAVWTDTNNGQSYYVITYYDDSVVKDTSAISEVPVRVGPRGQPVTLGAYANIRRDTGPVLVTRNQLARVAHVYMQTEGRDIGSAANELEKKLASDPRTKNVKFHFVGQIELMRTTFSGLGVALGLAVMVVFMIMATQFKSLRLPFVMLFTIPVSLVGIVGALMAAGQGLSITALMGVLMVIGIAVSNGILLVDHANRELENGMSPLDAVVDAARVRFTPILMTSLATVAGLMPTALGLDEASASNRPLALAVVGGLTSSTALSLFLVPAVFTILAKRKKKDPEEAILDDPHAGHLEEDPDGHLVPAE